MANAQSITPAVPRAYPYLVLAGALFAAAVGMMFIRMALNDGIPSPVIASSRMTIAVVVFTPFVLRNYRSTLQQLRRRDWLLLALGGLLFAGDLTMFSEAIKHTSILLATVIGGLSPLWTALLERLVLKTPLSNKVYMGLTLALAGGTFIALSGSDGAALGSNPLLGGVLALSSGLSAACYLVLARSLRPRIPLLPYIWMVFGFGAVVGLAAAFLTGANFVGHAPDSLFWVVLATIFGQMIAQPSFNFAVGYLSPTFISISAQSITVLASGLAFFLFNEVPGIGQLIGSSIILIGVAFAITGQNEFHKQ